jgi:hypothetical protein
MRREKIEAEVEFRPKGLGELKAKWTDFAGDLLEPVVLLAAGATKAQAAWAGMRGVFEARVPRAVGTGGGGEPRLSGTYAAAGGPVACGGDGGGDGRGVHREDRGWQIEGRG